MRILHVTDCYLPRLGGIELHVRDLVTHQRLAGDHARVVTLSPAGSEADPSWVARVPGRGGQPPGLPQAAAFLDRTLLADEIDVVHVHVSVFSPFATLAARLAGRRGLPTLVTVHSLWSGLGPLPAMARDLIGLRTWPVVWSAVSARAADPMTRMLGPGHTVHVLPNAVDLAQWRTDRPTQAELGPTTGPLTVMSVMRLTRVKRTLPLARILHDVRRAVPADVPLRAVIVGEGPRRAALERYLHRHGLDDWVELPGRLTRAEIRTRLFDTAVFVAPAEKESFGIAPLEARTAGVPVVASSLSGVGEFIRPGVNGFLGRTDVEIAAHVVDLLTDHDLRRRIARHNRLVAPQHDWAAAVSAADGLYALARATAPASTLVAG